MMRPGLGIQYLVVFIISILLDSRLVFEYNTCLEFFYRLEYKLCIYKQPFAFAFDFATLKSKHNMPTSMLNCDVLLTFPYSMYFPSEGINTIVVFCLVSFCVYTSNMRNQILA